MCAGRQLGGSLARGVRQCVLLVLGVCFLSPLYSTLTRSISDDTIVAASTWLLIAHLYLHDYHLGSNVNVRLVGSLSLAAAVSASVLLASRLSDPQDVVRAVCPTIPFTKVPLIRCIMTTDHWWLGSVCSRAWSDMYTISSYYIT